VDLIVRDMVRQDKVLLQRQSVARAELLRLLGEFLAAAGDPSVLVEIYGRSVDLPKLGKRKRVI
jgi:hypothetical protein